MIYSVDGSIKCSCWKTLIYLYHSYRLSNEIEAPSEPSPRGLPPTVIITQCPE